MIILFLKNGNILEERHIEDVTKLDGLPENTVWIDLHEPTRIEETTIEGFLGVDIPTREEMHAIEFSNRLYCEDNGLFITISAVKMTQMGHFTNTNITFVLIKNLVVTVRYAAYDAFRAFVSMAEGKPIVAVDCGLAVMLGIIENFIERVSEAFERISGTIEIASQKVFATDSAQMNKEFRKVLITIGRQGELNTMIRENLVTLSRAIVHLRQNLDMVDTTHSSEARIATIASDTNDLKEYSNFLGTKINFILDASLGLINIEQNTIIKIFSVVAVVFLPPTLIASIYGMNFHKMPELDWTIGYPMAIGLMLFSAVAPYFFFKVRGWL